MNSPIPSRQRIYIYRTHSIFSWSCHNYFNSDYNFNIILSFFYKIRKNFNKFIIEGQEIETIWTVLPAFLLIFIALPSLKTLYLIEDTKTPRITIKISGHQWYWSYEYTSLTIAETDNFMENSNTLRLLKTREILQLPVNSSIRAIVTSYDVIHSWTVPTMGVKVDALPGRLNQIFLFSKRLGLYTGQCSEICGTNHSFIPILIQVSSPKEFINKIKNF